MNPRMGRLVRIGEQVILVGSNGDRWPLEWVTFKAGSWGWDGDGLAKLPRPWVFDPATSAVLVEGDNVLITFLNGSGKRPVVEAGVVKVQRDAFLRASFAEGGAEQVRAQLRPRDANGAVLGTVRAQAGPDDGTLVVQVLDADDELQAELTLAPGGVQVRGPTVTLGQVAGEGAEPIIKGRTYVDDEADAMVQEAPILIAAAGFFGLPFDAITERSVTLAAAKASPEGEPYLSTVSETE